jgi:hypothetical protein
MMAERMALFIFLLMEISVGAPLRMMFPPLHLTVQQTEENMGGENGHILPVENGVILSLSSSLRDLWGSGISTSPSLLLTKGGEFHRF